MIVWCVGSYSMKLQCGAADLQRVDVYAPMQHIKNLSQYDGPRVLGSEPLDGILVVLSSNQIKIVTFGHQMGDTHRPPGEQTQQYLIDLN